MHAVLLLCRPLQNIVIQNFCMWGVYNLSKAYRDIKNPLPIAKWRTGKPAMVTLKIQLNCSTVHDMTLWANIHVYSHEGCGTDSVFIHFLQVSQIFQGGKSNENTQDFEKFKFDMSSSINPQNDKDLNQGLLHLLSKFGDPSLNGWWDIMRTNLVTDRQMDAGKDNTRRPILASGKNCTQDISSAISTHFYSSVWPKQIIFETISSRDPGHNFKMWCSSIIKPLNSCL